MQPSFTFIPIAEPRGLPKDLGKSLQALLKSNQYLLGDHSFSYLTLEEIDGLDIETPAKQVRYSPEETTLFLLREEMRRIYIRHADWLEKSGGQNKVRVIFGFDS